MFISMMEGVKERRKAVMLWKKIDIFWTSSLSVISKIVKVQLTILFVSIIFSLSGCSNEPRTINQRKEIKVYPPHWIQTE